MQNSNARFPYFEKLLRVKLYSRLFVFHLAFLTGVRVRVHQQVAEDVPRHRGEQGPERELQETLDKLWGTTGHRLLYPGAFALKM